MNRCTETKSAGEKKTLAYGRIRGAEILVCAMSPLSNTGDS